MATESDRPSDDLFRYVRDGSLTPEEQEMLRIVPLQHVLPGLLLAFLAALGAIAFFWHLNHRAVQEETLSRIERSLDRLGAELLDPRVPLGLYAGLVDEYGSLRAELDRSPWISEADPTLTGQYRSVLDDLATAGLFVAEQADFLGDDEIPQVLSVLSMVRREALRDIPHQPVVADLQSAVDDLVERGAARVVYLAGPSSTGGDRARAATLARGLAPYARDSGLAADLLDAADLLSSRSAPGTGSAPTMLGATPSSPIADRDAFGRRLDAALRGAVDSVRVGGQDLDTLYLYGSASARAMAAAILGDQARGEQVRRLGFKTLTSVSRSLLLQVDIDTGAEVVRPAEQGPVR